MEQEKMKIIYQMIIYGIELTKENIINRGISEEYLNHLLDIKYIYLTKDNTYQIYRIDNLRKYGVDLLRQQFYKEAYICFQKCYEMAPGCKSICMQYLLAELKHGHYENIGEIYHTLAKIQPEKNQQDNNLYLYLLNMLTTLPEEYIEQVSEMEPKDILLPASNCTKQENEFRLAITRGKYSFALHLLNRMYDCIEGYSVKFELIKTLLQQILDQEHEFHRTLINLANDERYNDIKQHLLLKQKDKKINKNEVNALLVADAITKIISTGIIPKVNRSNTYDITEVILNNNFQLALELKEEHMHKINDPDRMDITRILLIKINQIIEDVKYNTETKYTRVRIK